MRLLSAISVVAAVALTCAAPTHAQESGLKGVVRVRAAPIYTSGSPAGIAASYEFFPGESTSFLLTAGRVDRERSSDLCSGGAVGPLSFISPELQPNVTRQEATAAYAWHVDVRMIEVHATTIDLEVSWRRTSHSTPDEKVQYSQRLALRDGESRAIDLLHEGPGGECLGVAILIEASLSEDPSLRAKNIEWDLWASLGPTTVPHQRLRSVQGNPVEFAFDSMAVPGSADNRHESLYGTVTGRVRLDGRIEIAIDVSSVYAQKIVGQDEVIALLSKQRQRGTRGFRKDFTAKPGEAVKIVMPVRVQPATAGPVTGKPVIQPLQPGYELSITVQARVR